MFIDDMELIKASPKNDTYFFIIVEDLQKVFRSWQ